MAQVNYQEVVRLAEQLTPEERQTLIEYLKNIEEHRVLTKQQRKSMLDAMVVDLGAVLPTYSDRREDWYGDDGR